MMKGRIIFLGLLLSFGEPACVGQQKDSVFLYNGQVLIGDVQNASLGALSIDDLDLKVTSIKLYKIKRLRSREVFKIETVDKSKYYGTLDATEKEGWVVIRSDTIAVMKFPIITITQLTPLDKDFFRSLDGNISAGFSYAKSSGIGQVNLSANISWATRLLQYQLSGSEIGSIDSSKFSRDNETLQFFAGYDLNKTWFLAGDIQYQRNLELSIARRYLELLGAGNKVVVKDTWQLFAISGISVTQEKSTAGDASSLLWEVPLMFRFNFYRFHHPNIQITASQTAYFSLSEKGRIRYDGNTNFSWELIRYFYLTLNPYSSFDSKPPTGGGHTFDFGIAVSLTYKF